MTYKKRTFLNLAYNSLYVMSVGITSIQVTFILTPQCLPSALLYGSKLLTLIKSIKFIQKSPLKIRNKRVQATIQRKVLQLIHTSFHVI